MNPVIPALKKLRGVGKMRSPQLDAAWCDISRHKRQVLMFSTACKISGTFPRSDGEAALTIKITKIFA